ncbi:MAG: endonuclease III [Polyangiaceae bacterium]|nr:endonuclease III [Polyangiaceae bacterium]
MPARSKVAQSAYEIFERLKAIYPDADCELVPREPFPLLIAIVLSAQTTDVAVNSALPGLFDAFPTVHSFANAEPEAVADRIKTIGMYRQKARNVVGLAKQLVENHAGNVPTDFDALLALPGVGRKTANVLLGVGFGVASGVVVDTHVQRLSQRFGWTKETEPREIEDALSRLFEKQDWIMLSHVLIFHGRRVCIARAPACDTCQIADGCPSAGNAVKVGRKPGKTASKAARKTPEPTAESQHPVRDASLGRKRQ